MTQHSVAEPGLTAWWEGMPVIVTPEPPDPFHVGLARTFMAWSVQELDGGGYRVYGMSFYPWGETPEGDNHTVTLVSPDGVYWCAEPGLRMYRQPVPYFINSIFPLPIYLDGEGMRLMFSLIENYLYLLGGGRSAYLTWSAVSPDGLFFSTEPGTKMDTVDGSADARSEIVSLQDVTDGYRANLSTRDFLYSGIIRSKTSISPDGLFWCQEGLSFCFSMGGYQGSTAYHVHANYARSRYVECLDAYFYSAHVQDLPGNYPMTGYGLSPNGLNVCMEPGEIPRANQPVAIIPTDTTIHKATGPTYDINLGNGSRSVGHFAYVEPDRS